MQGWEATYKFAPYLRNKHGIAESGLYLLKCCPWKTLSHFLSVIEKEHFMFIVYLLLSIRKLPCRLSQ